MKVEAIGASLKGRRIGVVGLGAIGVEMAQALARLGIEVTAFARSPRLAGLRDDRINAVLQARLAQEFSLHTGHEVDIEAADGGLRLRAELGGLGGVSVHRQLGHRRLGGFFLAGARKDAVAGECAEIYSSLAWIDYTIDQERLVLDALCNLNEAEQAFTDAEKALAAGDLATYQAKIKQAQAAVKEAMTALGR